MIIGYDYPIKIDGISKALQKLVFEADITDAVKKEEEINSKLIGGINLL